MRTATVFNFLIEANLIAGIAILLMLPVRKFFRKRLGNRALCFAWLLVAIRLLCPLALPNPLISEIQTPYNYDPFAIRPIAGQVIVRLDDAVNDLASSMIRSLPKDSGQTSVQQRVNAQSPLFRAVFHQLTLFDSGIYNGQTARRAMLLYLSGAGAVILWFTLSNAAFRRKLKRARIEALSGEMLEEYRVLCAKKRVRPLPVYLTDPLQSACLVGVIRPYIALPLAAEPEQARQMLRHEICHYKALDHLWTLITLLCCVIHWFNPLVWLAASLSRTDRELKCDDNVTRDMNEEGRRQYAGALIQSVTRRNDPGIPVLATGMSMTGRKLKARVRGILQGGKAVRALSLGFAAVCTLLLTGAFATAEYITPAPVSAKTIREVREEILRHPLVQSTLSQENAVKTDEDAIRIAQQAFSLPALGGVPEDADWDANPADPEAGWGAAWWVIVTTQDNQWICLVNMDGSGMPFFHNAKVWNLREDAKEAPADERQELKDFACQFAEAVLPGITEHFTSWHQYRDEINGDVRLALIDAYLDDSMEDDCYSFIIQTAPELRIIDFSVGNG